MMIKLKNFFNHVKRFFYHLITDIAVKCKAGNEINELLRSLAVILIILILIMIIITLILIITIMFTSWLHFSDDFTLNNIRGSFLACVYCITALCVFGFIFAILLKMAQWLRDSWRQTSSKAVAKKLWE